MAEDIEAKFATVLAELGAISGGMDFRQAEKMADAIMAAPAVYVAGAGRSGMLLKCFAMRLMHMAKPVYVVGEMVTPAINAGDLLFIGSGSGETGSLAMMSRKAREVGARIGLITTNPKSTIAAMADVVLHINAPTPKSAVAGGITSIQPMGSLFEQTMFLLLETIIMDLMAKTGKTPEVMFKRHANLE